jgi:hypothetical protein
MVLFLITPLSAFYNGKLDIAKGVTRRDHHGNMIRSPRPDAEPFDDTRPLVFTHGDLSMRNIIFGRDGRIWLVDWDWSGFYPPWFEYVSMVQYMRRKMMWLLTHGTISFRTRCFTYHEVPKPYQSLYNLNCVFPYAARGSQW